MNFEREFLDSLLGPNVSRFPSAIPAGQRGKRDKSERGKRDKSAIECGQAEKPPDLAISDPSRFLPPGQPSARAIPPIGRTRPGHLKLSIAGSRNRDGSKGRRLYSELELN